MEAVINYETVASYRGSAYSDSTEVLKLVREFEACTLPRAEWTHQAHLVVALWYLVRYEEALATQLIREGIKRYNHAYGVEMTRTGGYHETITLFYVRVIRRFLSAANSDCTLAALANSLVNVYGDKHLPLEYYSRERLMSWEARTGWLEPDVKPLE